MKVSERQKTEWRENPVTLALKELCVKEFSAIVNSPRSDSFIRGNPQLTQENLVENACRELEWGAFLEFLDGNWSDLELDDEE